MYYYVGNIPVSDNYLAHHGIKGQKWGIRRFQNPDGSLTEAGKERYYDPERGENSRDQMGKAYNKTLYDHADPYDYASKSLSSSPDHKREIDKVIEDIHSDKEAVKLRDTYYKALAKYRRNINPFRAKQLYSDLGEATKKLGEYNQGLIDRASNMSMDIIKTMPKKDRDAAMAYVYMTLGLDW